LSDDDDQEGFLGGTTLGCKFWSEMRGGGDTGIRKFRAVCKTGKSRRNEMDDDRVGSGEADADLPSGSGRVIPEYSRPMVATSTKITPAIALKNQLYSAMRNALRWGPLKYSSCTLPSTSSLLNHPDRLAGSVTQR
jgi:hypothetical protein